MNELADDTKAPGNTMIIFSVIDASTWAFIHT